MTFHLMMTFYHTEYDGLQLSGSEDNLDQGLALQGSPEVHSLFCFSSE